jgi:hypothetical protein
MYVERLILNEFRAIAHSDVEFANPLATPATRGELPNVNLLLGTNGGGKSTILKAIAAAVLADRVDMTNLTGNAILSWPRIGGTGSCYARVAYRMQIPPRRGEPGGDDVDPFQGGLGVVSESWVTVNEGGIHHRTPTDDSVETKPTRLNLFGYGPQRLVDGALDPSLALDPMAMVANLFEQQQHLFPPEPWLPEVSEETRSAINLLMPPDVVLTAGMRGDEIEVENRGLRVSRGMLSDGAQSYMAWMLDLIFRLRETGDSPDFRDVRGTVLLDEIDQRMHPRWQQIVLPRLADGLPNLQFICSAHSPLLAGELRPGNLTVLEPDYDAPGEGAMKASRYEEDVFGRTADGVLTSSYFNLASSRPEGFQQELRRLADAAATIDGAAVEFIRKLAAGSSDEVQVRTELVRRPDRLRRRRQ